MNELSKSDIIKRWKRVLNKVSNSDQDLDSKAEDFARD